MMELHTAPALSRFAAFFVYNLRKKKNPTVDQKSSSVSNIFQTFYMFIIRLRLDLTELSFYMLKISWIYT